MDRGLVDFVISTGANLYHDLHYALNFTLRRGSPFLDDVELYEDGRHPHLRRAVSGDGAARNRRLHPRLHRAVRAERADRDLGIPLPARPRSARAVSRLRGALGGGARRDGRRADLHLVARRQLDRHEHRLSRADERQPLHDRSQQGRQRSVRHRARRQTERLRHSRRRIAEELLPAGAADAVGGVRHPQGRERLLHPDHDRLRSSGAGSLARRRPRP